MHSAQPANAARRTDAPLNKEVPRELHTVLSEQDKHLGELHGALAELERRLDCLMGPPAPSAAGEPASPPGNIVTQVNMNNQSIGHATSRIGQMLNRLHV